MGLVRQYFLVMKNLKIRVWDKLDNCWLESGGSLMGGRLVFAKAPENYEIELFTTYRDKENNEEIFEGDILDVSEGYDGDYRAVGGYFYVSLVDDGWAMLKEEGEYICSLFEAINNRDAVKVGNVHENPELLKRSSNR